jgi:aminopeptidase YwaD
VAAAKPALKVCLAVPSVFTIRILRPSAVLSVFAALLLIITASCGSDESNPAPSSSPTRTNTITRPPSLTSSPTPGIGAPQFESARALALVRALSVEIGVRAAGTDGERQAANFIRDELANYGYQASLQPFPIQRFVDVGTSLDILSPRQQSIAPQALGGSISAASEAQLVAAELGYPQQFPAGTAGSIVLIERGEITFGEKVANATAAGAAGVIIYNNESGPFVGQLQDESRIPAVSISREDGLALADLLSDEALTVRLNVETRTETADSHNVVARPSSGACRIVLGGHYDSVPAGPGANDNASGTATVIEIARAMAADGKFDDICFVLFGSEEIGLLGSEFYVRSLSADELAALQAMLNFDMLAVGDEWPLIGSNEVVTVAAQEADKLSIPHTARANIPDGSGSDHAPFLRRGVPAMVFNCFCDPNYHTADDRFEFVEEQRLAEVGAIGLATAKALLAAPP